MKISETDLEFIRTNIGREPRGAQEVVARCPSGHPLVIRVRGVVDNTPFPTTYWLVCREVCKQVDRMEAGGLIKELEAQIKDDITLRSKLENDHSTYAQKRESYLHPEDLAALEKIGARDKFKTSGVGGTQNWQTIKCLHSQYAYFFAYPKNRFLGQFNSHPTLCH